MSVAIPRQGMQVEGLFRYHAIIRPRLENLPSFEEMKDWISGLPNLEDFCLFGERGESKGDEKFNHYDAVIVLNNERRPDSLKRALVQQFEFSTLEKKNIRIYLIDDEKRFIYQLGYCLKEGIIVHYTFHDRLILEGRELYEQLGAFAYSNKLKKEAWTMDDVAHYYELWLKKNTNEEKPTAYAAESNLTVFLGHHKDKIKFSVWQRINRDKLIEYVSA